MVTQTGCELKQRLQSNVVAAMKAGEKFRLTTIRLIMAAIKQKEVDERIDPSDAQIVDIMNKMVKQRKDSITQFQMAKREDLAQKERDELAILAEFLPKPLDEAALKTIIDQAISDTAATTMKDMGKVMGKVKAATAGRADMGDVSKIIKEALT